MSDTLTLVGTLQTIEEKPSGWSTIKVAVAGKQYPVRLDTKLPALIQAARDTKGAVATWHYKEQTSEKINPNSGQPFVNRYFEKVELGANVASDGTPAPEPVHGALPYADEKRTITRQACLKAAAQIYQGVGADERVDAPLEVMRAAQRFEQWVYRGLDPTPFSDAPEPGPAPKPETVPDDMAHIPFGDDREEDEYR
jgi:hypothetical protein